MHWPRIRGLTASAGVRMRVNETEISAAVWPMRCGEDFTVLNLSAHWNHHHTFKVKVCFATHTLQLAKLYLSMIVAVHMFEPFQHLECRCATRLPVNIHNKSAI